MPKFEDRAVYPCTLPEAFAFFCRPANLIRISPPELHMQLVEAPEVIELNSRIAFTTQRMGVTQRIVSEITVFEPNRGIVDEQREGPFRLWRHAHAFAEVPGGTEITDLVEYEPPGGMLGFILTPAFIEGDLKWIFGYRNEKLTEMLGTKPA